MKKAASGLIILLFVFGLPGFGALAAPADAADDITDIITLEYHYTEGNEPAIPENIEEFYRDYNLDGVSEPILEAMLPITRTYVFRVDGAMTPEHMAMLGESGDYELIPVEAVLERNIDKVDIIAGLPNNEVDVLPLSKVFEIASAGSPGGREMAELQRAGVSFEITQRDEYGLPSLYTATVVYRGVETYVGVAYYRVKMSYTRTEVVGGVPQYVIIATYKPATIDPVPEIHNLQETTYYETPEDAGIVPGPAPWIPQEPESADVVTADIANYAPANVGETLTKMTPDERARANGQVLEEIRGQGLPIMMIGSMEVPLFGGGSLYVWSLVNLILGVICLALAIIIGIRFITQKLHERMEAGSVFMVPLEDRRQRRRNAWLITAAVMGIAGPVVFLLTESTALLMVLLDRWSIVNAAILAVEIIGYLLAFRRGGEEGYTDAEEEALA